MLKIFISSVLVFTFSALHSFAQNSGCAALKNGVFYSYPKNTSEQWRSERNGALQTEINLTVGDTSIWQINWQDDCHYTMKYVSGGKSFKKEELAFAKQHILAFKVEAVTNDYYVFSEYIDKISKTPAIKDTIWMAEKKAVANNKLFTALSAQDLRKLRIKDTSQYALLYVYRSSKMVCSLIEYYVNIDDLALCPVKSKSAYVFKIWKQGPVRLWAENKNKRSEEKLDIQFGHKYYLNCNIHWSADRCIPDLSVEKEDKGAAGFLEAQY